MGFLKPQADQGHQEFQPIAIQLQQFLHCTTVSSLFSLFSVLPNFCGFCLDVCFVYRLIMGYLNHCSGFPRALENLENLENHKKSSMHGKIMEFEKN